MNKTALRALFPALRRRVGGKKLVYLDNACSVLKPLPVIRAVDRYLSSLGACAGGRSGHALSAAVEELCHEARAKVASFIGAASPSELIFTANATEGLNLAARCFPFRKGKDEVVVTAFDHHSGLLPFLEEQRRGRARVRVAGLRGGWKLEAEEICRHIGPRTALVCLPLASNVTGQHLPLAEVAAAVRRHGAAVLADGAQYLSTSSLDVRAAGVDMLAFSGHKLGAPPGIGALYCRAGLMRRLDNWKVGGGTVTDVKLAGGLPRPSYFQDCRRFEAGIQNYAGIAGLGAAVDLLAGLGMAAIGRETSSLAAFCRERLAGFPEIELLGDGAAPCSPIVAFAFRDGRVFAQDFNIYLNSELPRSVVCARCGNHCAIPLHRSRGVSQSLRLSFFAYNTRGEVLEFLDGLRGYLAAAGARRRK